jgi:predicted small metal-binding protein
MASQSSSSQNARKIQYDAMQQTCMFFCCEDICKDCKFKVQGFSKVEIMRKFIEHAEKINNIDFLSSEIILEVNNAIKE